MTPDMSHLPQTEAVGETSRASNGAQVPAIPGSLNGQDTDLASMPVGILDRPVPDIVLYIVAVTAPPLFLWLTVQIY